MSSKYSDRFCLFREFKMSVFDVGTYEMVYDRMLLAFVCACRPVGDVRLIFLFRRRLGAGLAKQFVQPATPFKRDFEDHVFGHSCKVRDRLWFDNDFTQVGSITNKAKQTNALPDLWSTFGNVNLKGVCFNDNVNSDNDDDERLLEPFKSYLVCASCKDSLLTDRTAEAGHRELDLTNCIDADPKQLVPVIAECTALQRLQCTASTILPSDMIEFAMQQTSHLVEIELSCLVDSNTVEVEMNNIILSAHRQGHCTLNLRRIYCKVGPQHNIEILSALLHISPKADNLRVHLVCGDFKKTVQQCRVLLDLHKQLDKFTFTSEVLSPMQVEPVLLFDFAAYAAICANIHLASVKHVWKHVRQLCLLLLPPHPTSFYLGAGGKYRHCLCALSTHLKYVVEINISTFHFGTSLDVSALFQDDSLQFLQSLSALHCGFRRVPALRCLALQCPNFKELDVTLRRFAVTRCLYLLTETPLSLGAASDAVTKASRSRLKLKCVHAHYPSIVDPSIKETITRLRGPGRGKEAMTLMRLRLKGAQKGHNLLKKKADALQMRFRAILKKIVETKSLMGEVMKEAAFSLAEAKFTSGDFNQVVLQNVTRAQVKVRSRKDNVAADPAIDAQQSKAASREQELNEAMNALGATGTTYDDYVTVGAAVMMSECQTITENVVNSIATEDGDIDNGNKHGSHDSGELAVESVDLNFGEAVVTLDHLLQVRRAPMRR
ncbi:hypothetical protein HPB51_005153 [Rhipicephalus microplus]|uniref:Uncharacterized protein n=1 Tax=Rhipicephalus microplus TaxID=6941 RepID=A0A9J6DYU2_RHIMP|nr:hypothetical protein HPB51_005153 [Rhipicephalus microplus]